MRISLLSILLLLISVCMAQNERGTSFAVESFIAQQEDEYPFELIVYSSSQLDRSLLQGIGVRGQRYFKNFYRIQLNKAQWVEFKNKVPYDYIEIPGGKTFTLNDTMRSMNNVLPLHTGNNPQKLVRKGKNVLMGFIDTGIDFSHPDFRDSLGRTRVKSIWDQAADTLISSRIPSWGYGQVWDSSDIEAGSCPHDDDLFSHGTNVAGIAAGNGLAVNQYTGVAPESDIIVVASDFSASNWLQTVADGVEYIFKEADRMDMPCVINISAGQYLGSHDGTDLAALRIDSMIKAKRGRAVVAAIGNAGNQYHHLGYQVGSDTNFTWFEYVANSMLGYPAYYFQLWADTAKLNDVSFAFGANRKAPSFQFRGRTAFDKIQNRLNVVFQDSILNSNNDIVARVETFAELQGDKYMMEFLIRQPDSNQYYYSLMSTGQGRLDIWSAQWLGTSNIIINGIPTAQVLPEIVNYVKPDTMQSMVSSFTCLEDVISVGNIINRNQYLDYDTVLRQFNVVPGQLAENSSLGPTRRNLQKPNLVATGHYTITSNRLASIPIHLANNQADRIGIGGMHKRNGGSSMASPVVAGAVALLLSDCADMNAFQIREMLESSAKVDSVVGQAPNTEFGFGKLDVFEFWESHPRNVDLIPNGSYDLCKGDTIRVKSFSPMNEYSWYNGSIDSDIVVDSNQTVYFTGLDSNSCEVHSDTLEVISRPNPNTPKVVQVAYNYLETDSATSYQWYLNGNLISGATYRGLSIKESGEYQAQVFNEYDCDAFSKDLYIAIGIEEYGLDEAVQVFPNPSSNGFYQVSYSEMYNDGRMSILNAQGQIVQDGPISSELDLSKESEGIYMLKICGSTGSCSTMRLVKN